MSYSKTFVCLANSWKHGGHCVAGRELGVGTIGAWLRPVSARATRELTEAERRYPGGGEPEILDVVTLQLRGPAPELHQRENHEIESGHRWTKLGAMDWVTLQSGVESPRTLWSNGSRSSRGENDRVPEGELINIDRSLYLVRPHQLLLSVSTEERVGEKPRRVVRARFTLGGITYGIAVTDPQISAWLQAKPDGVTRMGPETLVCVSLGEAFQGYAYKLAAAIIAPQRAGRGR